MVGFITTFGRFSGRSGLPILRCFFSVAPHVSGERSVEAPAFIHEIGEMRVRSCWMKCGRVKVGVRVLEEKTMVEYPMRSILLAHNFWIMGKCLRDTLQTSVG